MQFIRSIIKSLFRGVANHVKWFSIIWTDRDFDYRYVYFLLEHKLKSMEATFSDSSKIYQIDESRLQILKYIRISRILLQRLIADDFVTVEEHAVLSSIKHEWVPCENPNMLEMRTIYSPPHEELNAIWDNSYARKNKTRRLFFLILEKRIEHWWD